MSKHFNEFTATEFQHHLKNTRTRLGLSRHDFALMVGIKPEIYRKYELGVRYPKEERGIKIIEALENYEKRVFSKRLDKAFELLSDIKNNNCFYIYNNESILSITAKFLEIIDKNL